METPGEGPVTMRRPMRPITRIAVRAYCLLCAGLLHADQHWSTNGMHRGVVGRTGGAGIGMLDAPKVGGHNWIQEFQLSYALWSEYDEPLQDFVFTWDWPGDGRTNGANWTVATLAHHPLDPAHGPGVVTVHDLARHADLLKRYLALRPVCVEVTAQIQFLDAQDHPFATGYKRVGITLLERAGMTPVSRAAGSPRWGDFFALIASRSGGEASPERLNRGVFQKAARVELSGPRITCMEWPEARIERIVQDYVKQEQAALGSPAVAASPTAAGAPSVAAEARGDEGVNPLDPQSAQADSAGNPLDPPPAGKVPRAANPLDPATSPSKDTRANPLDAEDKELGNPLDKHERLQREAGIPVVTRPNPGLVCAERILPVTGTVRDPTVGSVTIGVNGRKQPAAVSQGRFQADVALTQGTNLLETWAFGADLADRSPPVAVVCGAPPSRVWAQLSWNREATDVDLRVREPDGDEVFKGCKQGRGGGSLVREDHDGYGPELYTIASAAGDTCAPGEYQFTAEYAGGSGPVSGELVVWVDEEPRVTKSFTLYSLQDRVIITAVNVGAEK